MTDQKERESRSEFGRGLLVCLLGFLDHKSQICRLFEQARLLRNTDSIPAEARRLFSDGETSRMWANGANDHLYELEIPPRLEGTPLAAALKAFQDRWLEVGHGWDRNTLASEEEVMKGLHECERLALEVAAEVDKILGLPDAEVGVYT